MKRKINILISAVLILLILPMQFGCNKDKLLQETEEQAIIDANDDMPFPDTDPDGNPISPEDLTNSGNDKSVSINYVKITGNIDSWDIILNHEISACGLPAECDYKSYHFYRRKPKGETNFGSWIGYGWKNQHTYNSCNYARHTWNVSFREGDVIETFGFVYGSGFFVSKQGTTYTITDPTNADSEWEESLLSILIGQIDNLICRGFTTPLATIVNLGFPDLSPPNDAVIISVCDQYGNPLHAEIGHYPYNTEPTFLGSATFNDASDALGLISVHINEPNGPESYDDNLKNRSIWIDCTAYDNEDYWGYDTGNIPTICVTFNTNGTTTVDHPGAVDQEQLTRNCCASNYSWAYQSFTPTMSTLTSYEFKTCGAAVSPNPIVHIQIRENSFTGNIIATSSNSETINNVLDGHWVTFYFQGGVQLTPETEYFMTIVNENGRTFCIDLNWRNEYTRGKTSYPWSDSYDTMFRTYGY